MLGHKEIGARNANQKYERDGNVNNPQGLIDNLEFHVFARVHVFLSVSLYGVNNVFPSTN